MRCVFCGVVLCPSDSSPGTKERAINEHVADPGDVDVRPAWACKDLWDARLEQRAARLVEIERRRA